MNLPFDENLSETFSAQLSIADFAFCFKGFSAKNRSGKKLFNSMQPV